MSKKEQVCLLNDEKHHVFNSIAVLRCILRCIVKFSAIVF